MHVNNLVLSQSVWNFLILFTFIWVVLYISNPEWARNENDNEFDKYKAAWYAFAIAILTALGLWLLFWLFAWVNARRQPTETTSSGQKTVDPKHKKSVGKTSKSPLEKLQTLMAANGATGK
jgi:ABC-type Fe3+ transport system permease subunit